MNGQIIWSPGVPLENLIQQAVEAAVRFYKGNKTQTAQSLGISIRTLDARLDKYKKEKDAHAKRLDDTQKRKDEFTQRQRAVPPSAGFDSSATPSVHAREAERRRDAANLARRETEQARVANVGSAHSEVSGEGVRPEPAARAAAK